MFVFSLLRSGASISEILICLLALALAATIAIVLHETAHGFVALKCGDPTAKMSGRLTLDPTKHFDIVGLIMIVLVGFGWAKPVPINPNNFKNYKKGMICVSLAGIITNLLMCGLGLLILYLIYPFIGYYYVNLTSNFVIVLKMLAYYFIIFFVNINFMLAFFNFLPIYPLDGFKFLNLFLKPNNSYSTFMYRYGGYCLLGLVLLGNVLRNVGLEYLDIFYWASYLIEKLILVVVA